MSGKLITWEAAVQHLKSQPEQQELVRQCYYDDPLQAAADRYSHSEEWLAVKLLLDRHLPGKVLDLGAGRGISSYAFAQVGCTVTALEPDPSPIVGAGAIRSLIASSGVSIEIVPEYGETLPFANDTFDIVYGRAVMHHARNLSQFCLEADRVLKPGGVFIGTREHVISRPEDLPAFLAGHLLHHLYGGEHAYLLAEYLGAIESAGLDIVQVIAPYNSVINYAPKTTQEFQADIANKLQRVVGKALAQKLARIQQIQQLVGWYASRSTDTPGRLYTFMAVKK
jgi:2-polyprenyl-3-methyl-5-hydroxy-6-metoxy-1,4-benzoquinol methylase